MQPPPQPQSQTSQQLRHKIKYIYQHLIKLGYPKILQLSLSNPSQIQTYLTPYFQPTPSRIQLIQWLIAVIMPEYRQMSWYLLNEKDPLQRIVKTLWRIGVMPVNKHTKNLDYRRYAQAMVGYQNAIGLVFGLVQVAIQTVLIRKAKNDVAFGQFFHQMVDNFTQLVNQNYDLYGITFPCKFVDLNNQSSRQTSNDSDQKEQYLEEFQKQYEQFYQQKMLSLLESQDELFDKIYSKKDPRKQMIIQSISSRKQKVSDQQQKTESQLEKFVGLLAKYSRQYQDKYSRLVKKIDTLLQAPQTKSRLIPYYLNKRQQSVSTEPKPSVKQAIQNRSIKISPEFCKKYQQYKRILRQIKVPKDEREFMQKRTEILQELYQINQNIML